MVLVVKKKEIDFSANILKLVTQAEGHYNKHFLSTCEACSTRCIYVVLI